jgi:hypothetical protein
VKYYAQIWEKYANIDSQFIKDGEVEIRVGFKWENDKDSWSRVGASRLLVDKDKPTRNYGSFDENTREEVFSRTVTHEFGPALGGIHQDQSSANNIKWNEAKVITELRWNEAETRRQNFRKYQAA